MSQAFPPNLQPSADGLELGLDAGSPSLTFWRPNPCHTFAWSPPIVDILPQILHAPAWLKASGDLYPRAVPAINSLDIPAMPDWDRIGRSVAYERQLWTAYERIGSIMLAC